jgi:hypothetical protein
MKTSLRYCSDEELIWCRFVLKTKEQRAAEKALMDKSPLKTLTLEDFLESERHKLTGTLTPVTPETFAKWKKERLDKKAAEEEARKAKEATGKAMFESGDWKGSDDESDDDESDDDESDDDESDDDESDDDESDDDEGNDQDDDDGVWNLEAMRRETERLRALKEEERLAKANGEPLPSTNSDAVTSDVGEEDTNEGEG